MIDGAKTLGRSSSLFLASILALYVGASAGANADDLIGRTCFADDGPDRARCVVMIGVMRGTLIHTGKLDAACPLNDPNDLDVTYALIDWIRSHPERKDEDLGVLIQDGMADRYPCSRAALGL